MKNLIVSILAGVLALNALADTADQDVAAGRTYLAAQDVVHANQQFTNALVLSPSNESANALVAATRLLLLPTTPAGSNFLNSLGFSKAGRDIYNWTSSLSVNASGATLLPSNNTAVMVAFYRTNIMAALAASRTNLARITDPGFTLSLTADETAVQDVTVDYGDILLLQALERVAEFAGYTANAQNGNVVLSQLQALSKTNALSVQKLLSLYPSLLTLSNTNDLASSKAALTNAIALYFAASDFIRNVRAPGAPALFVLSDDATNDEAVFRTELTNALASLNGPATFNAADPVTINAGNYFSGKKTLRSLLPQFNGNVYVQNTLPDYSFGGLLVDEPAYLVEKQLRRMLPTYAGIYQGQVYDFNYNDPNAGNFAVFVGTNQQLTVVGYDSDCVNSSSYSQSGGILVQFTIDPHGNWQFENKDVSGNGWVGKDGSFGGELDFTSGASVELYNGYELSSQGPFQNAAGYYSGKFSGSSGSGTLSAVLSADGQLVLREMDTSGVYSDGAAAQLDSNRHFTAVSVGGTTVSATLNSSTFQFTGSFSSPGGNSGTASLTRSAKIPFDTPPVITKDLSATLRAPLGTNLSVSLTATGSPPLCYQWYAGELGGPPCCSVPSVIIPNATSNVFVLTNLQFSAAGTYSVIIDNVGGETNSAFNLIVVPETVPPTNQITAPTSGLQVSNALYTVAGKAGDNVAVSNVLIQINGGGWNPANSASQWANWTAQVPLVPGSNTVRAYAVDTCGNASTTQTVVFKYVVSAPLTVWTNGIGTLTPNENGARLQLGQSYAITAVPGTGFMFTNWAGGTNFPLGVITNRTTVQFVMVTNLVLQANFLDTNRPTLTISAPTAGKHMTNAVAMVAGTAADNWKVTAVWCQVNSNSWDLASSTNGWTNWVTVFKLVSGNNTIRAFASDLGGNVSLTNNVSVLSSNDFKLLLSLTNGQPVPGNGMALNLQVSPGLNGHIQVSTNLGDWRVFTNFAGTNTSLNFRDSAATNGSRFYRAVVP